MYYRRGTVVKGHYRLHKWVNGYSRKSSMVSSKIHKFTLLNTYVNTNAINYHQNQYAKLYKSIKLIKKWERIKLDNEEIIMTRFIFDSNYMLIIKEIFYIIQAYEIELKSFYDNNKDEKQFQSFLHSYIEENIEDEILEIENIKDYFCNYDEIVLVVLIFFLSRFEPNLYQIDFVDNIDSIDNPAIQSREYIIEEMKNLIFDNWIFLKQHFEKSNWEYERSNFFHRYISKKFYNPQIAMHMLFKEVCEEQLRKELPNK